MSEINEGIGESHDDGPILEGGIPSKKPRIGLKGSYESESFPVLEQAAQDLVRETSGVILEEPRIPPLERVETAPVPKLESIKATPKVPKLESIKATPKVPKLESTKVTPEVPKLESTKVTPEVPKLESTKVTPKVVEEKPAAVNKESLGQTFPKLESISYAAEIPKLEKVEVPPVEAPSLVKVYDDKFNMYLLVYQDMGSGTAAIAASFSESTFQKSVSISRNSDKTPLIIKPGTPLFNAVRVLLKSVSGSYPQSDPKLAHFQLDSTLKFQEIFRYTFFMDSTASCTDSDIEEFLIASNLSLTEENVNLARNILLGRPGNGRIRDETEIVAEISLFRVPMDAPFFHDNGQGRKSKLISDIGFVIKA